MHGQAGDLRLACLLPVRNGGPELRDWLDCVRLFCDDVVALDDGSTDDTARVLSADPLVRIVLSNPRRPTAAGWHDGQNRNRLLEAAAALEPDWLLFLDVDERLDRPDAHALRVFVECDAIPGFAYGLQHFRMWFGPDGDHLYDPECRWVYRLFAFERGQRLPADPLHFHPVPTGIPVERWLPTTIRIRHYGAATDGRVARRLAKYREADPEGRYPTDFAGLDTVPTQGLPGWPPRPPGLPVLVGDAPAPETTETGAAVSAVVIARDDHEVIGERLGTVVGQKTDESLEVIAVVSGSTATAAAVRDRHPGVRLVELADPVLPGRARNAGLSLATGDIVTFPGSHISLCPGALEARRRAHLRGYPMVAAATLNGTDTPAGWASYLLDHSAALPGRPAGELEGPPGNCSYDRRALDRVGGFPEDLRAGEDTLVNLELIRLGCRAWFEPAALQVHYSPCVTPAALARHHFRRGRGLAAVAVRAGPGALRAAWRESAPSERCARIAERVNAWADADLNDQRRAVTGLIRLGAVAYRLGLVAEMVRPRLTNWLAAAGRSGVTVLLVGVDRRSRRDNGRADVAMVARASLVDGRVRIVSLPRDLLVDLGDRGPQKLASAHALGGRRLFVDAVQTAFGVRSDIVLTVDFTGFRKVVDRLGGIEVDVVRPIFDPLAAEGSQHLASADIRTGRQRLDGRKALAYARSRRVDGDIGRRQRQVDLARALATRARAIHSPLRAMWAGVTGARAVEISGSPGALFRLAWAARRFEPSRVVGETLDAPLIRAARLPDGRYVQEADPEELRATVQRLLALA